MPSHDRVGFGFVRRYLKVSTAGTPDKPRDIWKCQSDKYGSCVVVMQPLPRSLVDPFANLVCLTRVVVLPRLSSLSNPTLPFPPRLRPMLSPSESVAPAGDRFAPGMKVLSQLERYREIQTSLWKGFSLRSFPSRRIEILRQSLVDSVSSVDHFYFSRCA